MLRRKAFTSLQHGFLRSVENGFIHNFVIPNDVCEMFFFIILTLIFIMIVWQMLCLIVSLADVFAWQILFAFWNVADVIAKGKMLSSYFCVIGRCYCHIFVEDIIPLFIMLQHIVLADVIAKWKME